MKVNEFLNIARKIANETPTKYKLGGVGQHEGKTFLFDCGGLIKSILWGFNFDYSQYRGGAIYESNGVEDKGCNDFFDEYCYDVSSDFSNIQPGELVVMDGHIGIADENRKCIEATAAWESKVLISDIGLKGQRTRNGRQVYSWGLHGKLKFLEYDAPKPEPIPTPTKTIEELAKEVIEGKWGNNPERKEKLIAAGYDYEAIQNKVNEMLAPKVDMLDLVKKTIRGDFGNGDERKRALGSNYDEVQRQVNLNFQNGTTRWDNIKLY